MSENILGWIWMWAAVLHRVICCSCSCGCLLWTWEFVGYMIRHAAWDILGTVVSRHLFRVGWQQKILLPYAICHEAWDIFGTAVSRHVFRVGWQQKIFLPPKQIQKLKTSPLRVCWAHSWRRFHRPFFSQIRRRAAHHYIKKRIKICLQPAELELTEHIRH